MNRFLTTVVFFSKRALVMAFFFLQKGHLSKFGGGGNTPPTPPVAPALDYVSSSQRFYKRILNTFLLLLHRIYRLSWTSWSRGSTHSFKVIQFTAGSTLLSKCGTKISLQTVHISAVWAKISLNGYFHHRRYAISPNVEMCQLRFLNHALAVAGPQKGAFRFWNLTSCTSDVEPHNSLILRSDNYRGISKVTGAATF